MSTPPPPPAFSAPTSRKSGFPWMACGIGCLIVFLAAVGVVAFIGYKANQAFKEIEAGVERMAEVGKRKNAARERIASLDEANPPTIGEDLSTVELQETEVSQFTDLHARLAGPLVAHADVKTRIAEFEEKLAGWDEGAEPSFRELLGVMSEAKNAMSSGMDLEETLATLLEDAAMAMESLGMGRTQLRRLLAITQWRFLGREGFDELALDADDWSALESARSQVELWGDDEFDPNFWERQEWDDLQEELVEHRKTIQRLEARIGSSRTELTPSTSALLEAHRTELEAIPSRDALAMLELIREGYDFEGFDALPGQPDEDTGDAPEAGSEG